MNQASLSIYNNKSKTCKLNKQPNSKWTAEQWNDHWAEAARAEAARVEKAYSDMNFVHQASSVL